MIIEVAIYILWLMAFLSRFRWRSRAVVEERLILTLGLLTTTVMEMVNEVAFRGRGAYYPCSLVYFPAFRFPLAIIFAGALFSFSIYKVSVLLAKRVIAKDSASSTVISVALFMLLLLGYGLVEFVGTTTGYWRFYGEIRFSLQTLLSMYTFYFLVAAPAVLFAKALARCLKASG